MIVIDASAILELLLKKPLAGAIAERLFETGETLHAPHLIDIETVHVLRRYGRIGEEEVGRLLLALDDFRDLQIERYSHAMLLPRIWELRHNVTAYDAAYIALAELLGVALLTCDRRLAGMPGHDARIDLIG